MAEIKRRPIGTPPYHVQRTAPHQILVCKACKSLKPGSGNGARLMRRLREAFSKTELVSQFEVTGTACLAGCVPAHGSACVAAWCAADKATWMFGKIDPDAEFNDLIQFSRLYAALDDGWCSGADCPAQLCENTLARIPASLPSLAKGRLQGQISA